MRIEWFKAKGFRSLRDVEIDGLGPFNVFYGPNGAGKSNLLAAMQLLFAILEYRSTPGHSFDNKSDTWRPEPGLIDERDRCQIDRPAEMILSAQLRWAPNEKFVIHKPPALQKLTVEISYEWDRSTLHLLRLEDAAGVSLIPVQPTLMSPEQREEQRESLRRNQNFVHTVARTAFSLIDAVRTPFPEQSDSGSKETIEWLLHAGRLKEALLRASKHPDAGVRKRYKQLGMLLEGPPFNRPPFEMTEDPQTGRIELVETVGDPPRDIPLDLVGLGLAQIYYILARAMLGNTRTAGIEEPEAHLHAPTTGIELRQVLVRLVNEGYLDQLFIATHSNLFDLDPDGYFDVSFDPELGTQVQRKQLDQIDIDHLYEPGPAKHILQRLLRRMDENTVLFRRPDGSPISIREMLELLQRDDPLAKEFLNDVHGAAVHAVRIKNKTPAPASGT